MKKIIFSILLITTTTFITTVHGLRIIMDGPNYLPLTINLQGKNFLITDDSQEINLDGSPIVIRDLASLTLCVKGVTYRPHKWWPYYNTIGHIPLTRLRIKDREFAGELPKTVIGDYDCRLSSPPYYIYLPLELAPELQLSPNGLRIIIDEPDDLPLTINLQGENFLITDHSQEINLEGAPIVIGDLASLTLCVKGVTYRPHKWWPDYDTISDVPLKVLTIENQEYNHKERMKVIGDYYRPFGHPPYSISLPLVLAPESELPSALQSKP